MTDAAYLGYTDASKRPASDKVRAAIEAFVRHYGRLPVEVRCHADDVVAVPGVEVLGRATGGRVFLGGPVPAGEG